MENTPNEKWEQIGADIEGANEDSRDAPEGYYTNGDPNLPYNHTDFEMQRLMGGMDAQEDVVVEGLVHDPLSDAIYIRNDHYNDMQGFQVLPQTDQQNRVEKYWHGGEQMQVTQMHNETNELIQVQPQNQNLQQQAYVVTSSRQDGQYAQPIDQNYQCVSNPYFADTANAATSSHSSYSYTSLTGSGSESVQNLPASGPCKMVSSDNVNQFRYRNDVQHYTISTATTTDPAEMMKQPRKRSYDDPQEDAEDSDLDDEEELLEEVDLFDGDEYYDEETTFNMDYIPTAHRAWTSLDRLGDTTDVFVPPLRKRRPKKVNRENSNAANKGEGGEEGDDGVQEKENLDANATFTAPANSSVVGRRRPTECENNLVGAPRRDSEFLKVARFSFEQSFKKSGKTLARKPTKSTVSTSDDSNSSVDVRRQRLSSLHLGHNLNYSFESFNKGREPQRRYSTSSGSPSVRAPLNWEELEDTPRTMHRVNALKPKVVGSSEDSPPPQLERQEIDDSIPPISLKNSKDAAWFASRQEEKERHRLSGSGGQLFRRLSSSNHDETLPTPSITPKLKRAAYAEAARRRTAASMGPVEQKQSYVHCNCHSLKVDMRDYKTSDHEAPRARAHMCDQSRVLLARLANWNREYCKRLGLDAAGTIFARPDQLTAAQLGFCAGTVKRCAEMSNDYLMFPKCTDKLGIAEDKLEELKEAFKDDDTLCGAKLELPVRVFTTPNVTMTRHRSSVKAEADTADLNSSGWEFVLPKARELDDGRALRDAQENGGTLKQKKDVALDASPEEAKVFGRPRTRKRASDEQHDQDDHGYTGSTPSRRSSRNHQRRRVFELIESDADQDEDESNLTDGGDTGVLAADSKTPNSCPAKLTSPHSDENADTKTATLVAAVEQQTTPKLPTLPGAVVDVVGESVKRQRGRPSRNRSAVVKASVVVEPKSTPKMSPKTSETKSATKKKPLVAVVVGGVVDVTSALSAEYEKNLAEALLDLEKSVVADGGRLEVIERIENASEMNANDDNTEMKTTTTTTTAEEAAT